ncbi:MAG: SPOR domain-containing protein [Spirochaetota bacterium]
MEQRRVLLIIVSVAIILAAIVGVGIWLFYPRDGAEPQELAEAEGGFEYDPLDYLHGDGDVPGLEDEGEPEDEEGDFVVQYGVLEEEGVDQADGGFVDERPAFAHPGDATRPNDRDPAPAGRDALAADRPAGDGDGRSTPAGQAEPRDDTRTSVGDERERTAAQPSASRKIAEPRTPSGAIESREPAPARDTEPTRSEPAPGARLADRAYWVQVISSPNRDTIEQSQLTLREHQLGSRILTKEIGDTIYFRLRLGPFAEREEAEKFLGWVTEIRGFADAMVFVDYTTPVLAARVD